MKHILHTFIPAMAAVLAMLAMLTTTSCRSTKGVVKPSAPQPSTTAPTTDPATTSASATADAFVRKVAAQAQTAPCLTAKAKVELQGMGKSLSINGQLRMKRDDVVQLSLSFLGMEVGRMEFTPQDVLIVDRMNKQYVRAAYSEVSFLKRANLDFYSLQALFWNELFIPGERTVAGHTARFRLASTESSVTTLTLADTPQLTYTFVASTPRSLIEQLQVKGKKADDKGAFAFTYSDFATFNARPFPTTMCMAVSGTGHDLSLTLRLSRLTTDSGWQQRTTVSGKYTRRTPEEVLGRLLK